MAYDTVAKGLSKNMDVFLPEYITSSDSNFHSPEGLIKFLHLAPGTYTLNQMNEANKFSSYFSKAKNIIFQLMPRFRKWPLPFRFSN
jgi:hypothetical protein